MAAAGTSWCHLLGDGHTQDSPMGTAPTYGLIYEKHNGCLTRTVHPLDASRGPVFAQCQREAIFRTERYILRPMYIHVRHVYMGIRSRMYVLWGTEGLRCLCKCSTWGSCSYAPTLVCLNVCVELRKSSLGCDGELCGWEDERCPGAETNGRGLHKGKLHQLPVLTTRYIDFHTL